MDTLIVLALAAGAAYLAVCAWWPFAACRRCNGTGKRRSPSGKAFRLCPRCKGTGRRIRLGRLLWELGRGARRDRDD